MAHKGTNSRKRKDSSSPQRPFVVYWNNIPAPYMVERFNALADRGRLDFQAWFNDRSEPGRSWIVDEAAWRFDSRYLPSCHLGQRRLHCPLPLLGRKPDLLISLYAQPSYLCGWLIAKLRRVPTAFWCEPTFDRWVARSRLKEGIKRFVFSRVDMTIGSGQDGRNYAMRYGVAAQRARVLRHAVDIDHFREGRRTCLARRGALRAELGLHGLIFVYVGRLWWGKGLATLLEAFFRVQRAGRHPVGLLLVGDGPEEESLRHACAAHGIENVHFAGFRSKEELPRFLAAADVFVFPSLGDPYGLSVDEAMASSLPVISTTAAGEIASRIQPGLNGYLVPPEDSPTLAEAMLQFVHSPGLAEEMGQRSRHKLGAWTPERWAEALEAIVLTSLAPGAADEGHGIIVRSGSSDP